MSFRIIGIEPHEKCNPDIKKVLNADTIYYLYNNYEIVNDKVHKLFNAVPEQLYKLGNNKSVNISAIVGKNGSGKSSLLDVLYAVLFVSSWKYKLLPASAKTGKEEIKKLNLHATVYFEQGDGEYHALRCKGTNLQHLRQLPKDEKILVWKTPTAQQINSLFYTVVSNYSMFAFSANSGNRWMQKVFEKNDGYQLPLVINPFRDGANINIDSEDFLVRSRLLTNLLATGKNNEPLYNELAPGRFVDGIKLTYRKEKMTISGLTTDLHAALKDNRIVIMKIVYKTFFNRTFSERDTNRKIDGAANYIVLKLFKITLKYRPYQGKEYKFIEEIATIAKTSKITRKAKTEYKFFPTRLRALLKKMKKNPSHITFKWYQTLHYIENFQFYDNLTGRLIKLEQLRPAVRELAEQSGKEVIDLVPAPIFKVDIQFKDKGHLNALSSGEKQRVYNSSSWMYHLINILSVKPEKRRQYHRFDAINIVFDEIELYYHPEMQRNFIKDFLESLNRLPLTSETSINCIFITHSPFILSDIPTQNILFLDKDGEIHANAQQNQTFGANIHELLQKNFFLEDGTMGAFAQNLITDIINYLKKAENPREWNKVIVYSYIELVSEPILRRSLMDLYHVKFATDIEIESRIKEMQQLLTTRKKETNAKD